MGGNYATGSPDEMSSAGKGIGLVAQRKAEVVKGGAISLGSKLLRCGKIPGDPNRMRPCRTWVEGGGGGLSGWGREKRQTAREVSVEC